jgi:hypothetical protein
MVQMIKESINQCECVEDVACVISPYWCNWLMLTVTSAYELSLASGLRFERRLFQSTFGTVSGKQTLFMQSGWMASNYLLRCRMTKEKEWLLSLKRESQHLLTIRIPLVWLFDFIRIVVCDGQLKITTHKNKIQNVKKETDQSREKKRW